MTNLLYLDINGGFTAPPGSGGGGASVAIGPGLAGSTVAGTVTLGLIPLAAGALSGNASGGAAAPSGVPVGPGLILSGSLAALWQGPTITAIGANISTAGGTLSATGGGGSAATFTDSIVSAGSNQATGTALTSDLNIVTSGTGVVVLSGSVAVGGRQWVQNMGTVALPVLPQTGARIGTGAINAAVTIAAGTPDAPVKMEFLNRGSVSGTNTWSAA